MTTMNLLVYILLAVTGISVFFTVAAWFYLSSIGAKLSILERETEKRSLEFDSLRKEVPAPPETSSAVSVIEESDSIPLSTVSEAVPGTGSIEDTIQIFRNVRGRFDDQHETDDREVEPVQTSEEVTDHNIMDSPAEDEPEAEPPDDSIVQPATSVEVPPPPSVQPEIVTPSDELVDSAPVSQTFSLQLYSDSTKDADFQKMWKDITHILQEHSHPDIAIDLSGINFLYEKEMDYLEKINYLITKQGGSLSLDNCDKDLFALINHKPALGSITKL